MAAVRAQTATPLRRLLITGGFLAAAWMLGTAPAGAETELERPVEAPAAERSTEAGAAAADARGPSTEHREHQAEAEKRPAARPNTEARASAAPQHQSVASTASTVKSVGERAVRQVPTITKPKPQAPAGDSRGRGNGHSATSVGDVVEKVGHAGLGATEKGRSALPGLPGGAEKPAETRPADRGPDAHGAEEPEPAAPTSEDDEEKADGTADAPTPAVRTDEAFPFPASAVANSAWEAASDSTTDAGTNASPASQDDDAPHTSQRIVGSAPQAQGPTAMTMLAGYLPATSLAAPSSGLLQADRHALAAIPQDPAEEPTVSPD
ncbi:hypothetical protein CDO52_01335 [Nocardiopsis gilva YIM 90087]|uniref:Uncharacterized protein n=1 Tax=Nocardiopsis gilva YIM 90087 TaxID=1235441 RepID=A0A223S0I6_9ACTN|nr:hypothetical protein CDO52_01335 [Nocardiopsis gilva YIM 90087]